MSELYDRVQAAAAAVRQRVPAWQPPQIGLILGSGLGGYADKLMGSVASASPALPGEAAPPHGGAVSIDYSEIPHFPRSHVVGHAGRLIVGARSGARCIAMQGRVHMYEGYDASTVAFPARVLIALGAKILIVTNAAGGLEPSWPPGSLMLIRDHIDMLRDHALRGPNDDRLGTRFPDMTRAYAPELRELARAAATSANIVLREGVYVAMPGPTYETPAEIKMLKIIGADATGMSTVPEVVVAAHMGARVIGISCITNHAAGITGHALSHTEVTETAARVRTTFETLLDGIIGQLVAAREVTA